MAVQTQTYSFIDTLGNVDSVTITFEVMSIKEIVHPRGMRRTRFQREYEAKSEIRLSKPLPATLEINFIRRSITDYHNNAPIKTVTTPAVVKVPRGTILFPFTYKSDIIYLSTDPDNRRATGFTYELVAQNVVPEKPPVEPDIIDQDDVAFSDIPALMFTFDEVQPKSTTAVNWRIEIIKRGITQGLRELDCMGGIPLVLETRSPQKYGVYAPLHAGAATLNFFCKEEGEFEELFTAQDANLRLDVYRNNKLYFQGFNIAALYAEPYKAPPFEVTVDFTCGLQLLKRIPYEVDLDSPRKRITDVLRKCFDRLGSTIPVYEGIFTYPEQIETDIRKGPFGYATVDERVYQNSKGMFSCGQVIEAILKPFAAVLFQCNTYVDGASWIIREQNAMIQDLPYRFYRYDNDPGTTPVMQNRRVPLLTIQPDGDKQPYQINAMGSLKERKPALKEVIITRKLDYIQQLFPGGEFDATSVYNGDQIRDWTKTEGATIKLGTSGGRQIKTDRGGFGTVDANYTLMLRTFGGYTRPIDNTLTSEEYIASTPVAVAVENGNTFSIYMQMRWKVEHRDILDALALYATEITHMILPIQVKIGNYYLHEDKMWSTDPYTILITNTVYNSFFSFIIEDIPVPADADLQMTIFPPAPPHLGVPIIDNLFNGVDLWADIDFIRGQYLPSGHFAVTSDTLYATALSFMAAEPYEDEVMHADVDTVQNISAIMVGTELTTRWQRYYASGESLPLVELMAKKILDNHISEKSWTLKNFEVIENGSGLSYMHVVTTAEMPERRFICTGWRYTPVNNRIHGAISCDWVEVNNANVRPTFEYNTGTGIYGSSGGGGGGSVLNYTQPDPFDIMQYLTSGTVAEPVMVKLSNGKFAIDAADLGIEEFVVPGLNEVTLKGAISEQAIEIGSLTEPLFNLRITNEAVHKIAGTLRMQGGTGVSVVSGSSQTFYTDSGGFYLSKKDEITPEMLIGITTGSKLGRVRPSQAIKLRDGDPLAWNANGDTLQYTGSTEVFSKSYNDLLQDTVPFWNQTGNVKQSTGFVKISQWDTGAYYQLVTSAINGTLQRYSPDSIGIATRVWVDNKYEYLTNIDIASKEYVHNYVANNGGSSDGNNYTTAILFDDSTRVFRLRRYGLTDLTVTIPDKTGTGGDGGDVLSGFWANGGRPYISFSNGKSNMYMDVHLDTVFLKKSNFSLINVAAQSAVIVSAGAQIIYTYNFTTANISATGYVEVRFSGSGSSEEQAFGEVRINGAVTSRVDDRVYATSTGHSICIPVAVSGSGTKKLEIRAFIGGGTNIYARVERMRIEQKVI